MLAGMLSPGPSLSTLGGTWLPRRSSDKEPANEFRREETLLSAEAGPEAPSMIGVTGPEGVEMGLNGGVMGGSGRGDVSSS